MPPVQNEKETILGISQCNVWQYNTAPILSGHVRAGSCPSQELIDCYETIDGKQPILGYSDADHLQPVINPEATLYDEKQALREPRPASLRLPYIIMELMPTCLIMFPSLLSTPAKEHLTEYR